MITRDSFLTIHEIVIDVIAFIVLVILVVLFVVLEFLVPIYNPWMRHDPEIDRSQ